MDLNGYFTGEAFITAIVIAGLFVLILAVFLLVQSDINRKDRKSMVKIMIDSQSETMRNTVRILTQKLAEYTEGTLTYKIRSDYTGLITQDLLPSVNRAADRIADLAAETSASCQVIIDSLTGIITEAFNAGTNEYFKREADTIRKIENASASFAIGLEKIVESLGKLSEKISTIYEQTASISNNLVRVTGNAVETLGISSEKFSSLLEKLLNTVNDIQENARDNSRIYNEFKETAKQISQLTTGAAILISEQNNKTAVLLDNAAEKTGRGSESAIQTMISVTAGYTGKLSDAMNAFGEGLEKHITNLQLVTQQLDNSVKSLKEDAGNSTARFETGIEKTVATTLGQMDKSLAEITGHLADVTANIQEAADSLPRVVRSMLGRE